MSIPGFTADASLYATGNSYASLGYYGQGSGVLPALQKGGGNPWIECISDCADSLCQPGWTAAHCRSFCQQHCRAGIDAGPTGPNTVDCILCKAGCAAWKAACSASVFGFLCDFVPCDCPVCD
jgi:hypothetical protein